MPCFELPSRRIALCAKYKIKILYYDEIYGMIVAHNAKKEGYIMSKYQCVCGYIYDPELGDPDNGVAPGTAFEDVPDDWTCPVCGLSKDAFTEI